MVNIQIQGVSLNDIHKWKWKTKDERKDIVHSKTYFQQLLSKYCSQKHLKQLEINQEIKSTFFGRSVFLFVWVDALHRKESGHDQLVILKPFNEKIFVAYFVLLQL